MSSIYAIVTMINIAQKIKQIWTAKSKTKNAEKNKRKGKR
jgi:hypothetical protein